MVAKPVEIGITIVVISKICNKASKCCFVRRQCLLTELLDWTTGLTQNGVKCAIRIGEKLIMFIQPISLLNLLT